MCRWWKPHRTDSLLILVCNTLFYSKAPLLVCWVLNDGLLSIYDMLLELVRQHTFEKESQRRRENQPCPSKWHLQNKTQALLNITKLLTFDRWAFEWLSYFVPGFCYLSILRNKQIQYTQIMNSILHNLIAKCRKHQVFTSAKLDMCFTEIRWNTRRKILEQADGNKQFYVPDYQV